MAVTFIKKGSKAIKESAPTIVTNDAAPPKPYKKLKAIEAPHQFTVHMAPAWKTELKILAARLAVTNTTLYTEALVDFVETQPLVIRSPEPPDGKRVRFVFKVTQEVAASVHSLADLRGTSCQAVILAAMTRLLLNNGVTLG